MFLVNSELNIFTTLDLFSKKTVQFEDESEAPQRDVMEQELSLVQFPSRHKSLKCSFPEQYILMLYITTVPSRQWDPVVMHYLTE